jgi:ADP-heptose:LPS heptosyltransferase
MMIYQKAPKRILIQRTGAIGDVLIASAVLPPLAKQNPEYKIDFETACDVVVKNSRYIDRILPPGKTNFSEYDRVINLNNVYEKKPHVSILGAFANKAGINENEIHLFYNPSDSQKKIADLILLKHGLKGKKLIAVQSGASFWLKIMEPKFLDKILNDLYQVYSISFVLLGTPNDPLISGTVDLRGKCSVAESAAVLQQCKGFIGHDSALIHFAKAMSIPVAAFFGNTDPLKRILQEKNDCLFVSQAPCRFCYHRRKSPVIISFCEKQTLFWRILDWAIQIALNCSSLKKNLFTRYATLKMYSYQEGIRNGKKIAVCMKNIESQKVFERFSIWFQDIGIQRK